MTKISKYEKKELSYKLKRALCMHYENHKLKNKKYTKTELARQFTGIIGYQLSKSTIGDILKNKNKWLELGEEFDGLRNRNKRLLRVEKDTDKKEEEANLTDCLKGMYENNVDISDLSAEEEEEEEEEEIKEENEDTHHDDYETEIDHVNEIVIEQEEAISHCDELFNFFKHNQLFVINDSVFNAFGLIKDELLALKSNSRMNEISNIL